jgi:hypothetical protein
MSPDDGRSYASITTRHLKKLTRLIVREHKAWSETRHDLKGQLVAGCLAQGAAQHLLHGSGIKDFDLWLFYDRSHLEKGLKEHGVRSQTDFGPSVFGRYPGDPATYLGRRVDFMCRRLPADVPREPADTAVLAWLQSDNESPKWLRKKPVILLWPARYHGAVIWDPQADL